MAFIELTQGKQAIVDDADYEYLAQFKWQYRSDGYAVRDEYVEPYKTRKIRMHREIMALGKENAKVVDHINHDGLDNRRANLRICTRSQNQMNRGLQSNNTTGITGVKWDKSLSRWRAEIKVDRKVKYLGVFKDINDAIKARKDGAEKYHGDFTYGLQR